MIEHCPAPGIDHTIARETPIMRQRYLTHGAKGGLVRRVDDRCGHQSPRPRCHRAGHRLEVIRLLLRTNRSLPGREHARPVGACRASHCPDPTAIIFSNTRQSRFRRPHRIETRIASGVCWKPVSVAFEGSKQIARFRVLLEKVTDTSRNPKGAARRFCQRAIVRFTGDIEADSRITARRATRGARVSN